MAHRSAVGSAREAEGAGRLAQAVAGTRLGGLVDEQAWSAEEWPNNGAAPCSVTMTECWNEVVGVVRNGTMVEVSDASCHERSARTACPPGECMDPETKSGWPPKPE